VNAKAAELSRWLNVRFRVLLLGEKGKISCTAKESWGKTRESGEQMRAKMRMEN
jgi:hypothetical protein